MTRFLSLLPLVIIALFSSNAHTLHALHPDNNITRAIYQLPFNITITNTMALIRARKRGCAFAPKGGRGPVLKGGRNAGGAHPPACSGRRLHDSYPPFDASRCQLHHRRHNRHIFPSNADTPRISQHYHEAKTRRKHLWRHQKPNLAKFSKYFSATFTFDSLTEERRNYLSANETFAKLPPSHTEISVYSPYYSLLNVCLKILPASF